MFSSRLGLSFRPITSRIASRISPRSLADCAERTVELGPGKAWNVDLPVMLPDEPDRIKGHHSDSTPARNLALLTERTIHQGPTRAHLLRDVLIADGTVLTPTAYDRIAECGTRPVLRSLPEYVFEAALCSTHVTQRYFGHWLKDGLAHEMLAKDQGIPSLVLDSKPWTHEAAYRDLTNLHAMRSNYAWVDRLWLLEDHEMNDHFADRFGRLRDKIIRTEGSEQRVYLSRGKGVGRTFANEHEVRDALETRGFTILDPEERTVEEIVSTLSSASLVVSPEGSANIHASLAMPSGSAFLSIVGAQHFNLLQKLDCDMAGVRFGLTIADAVNEDAYHQPIDRLLRAIDLVSDRRA